MALLVLALVMAPVGGLVSAWGAPPGDRTAGTLGLKVAPTGP